jgi:hypothetical protein
MEWIGLKKSSLVMLLLLQAALLLSMIFFHARIPMVIVSILSVIALFYLRMRYVGWKITLPLRKIDKSVLGEIIWAPIIYPTYASCLVILDTVGRQESVTPYDIACFLFLAILCVWCLGEALKRVVF